jgi:poly(3-hydroxybutyrate) depolymerase
MLRFPAPPISRRTVPLVVLFGLVTALAAACANPISRDGSVAGAGSYRLHLDDSLGKAVRPLVVVLGGLDQSPADIETGSGLDPYAVAHGFTVAYVASTTRSWNAGPQCCTPDSALNTDDVSRIAQLIRAIDARMTGRVDLHRTYLWGFSNGAMMASRYACSRPGVAAAGMVAGPLLVPCSLPARLVHVHAVDDAIAPLHGGLGCACFGPALGPFPDSSTEGSRLPPGSIWKLVTYTGNHVWPSGAADQLWNFSSAFRA